MATYSGGFDNSGYTLYLDVSESNVSVANNNSVVNWTLRIVSTKALVYGSWDGYGTPYSVSINGSQVASGNKTYDFRNYQNLTIASGSVTIGHNSDGSKSVSCSASFGNSSTPIGDAYCNGTFTLTTIPRQANITSAPNFNDEENPTITYNNSAGNSVSSLQACISLTSAFDDITYRDIPKTGSSYTFELTEDERNLLRNACTTSNSRNVIFFVKTVIGGVTYYSTLSKTLTIINASPSVSLTAIDINETTKALTGDENKFIKYFSNASLKLTTYTEKQAIVSSTKITCEDGKSSSSTSVTFNNVESASFTGVVIDSRGNSNATVLNKTLIDYIKLTCNVIAYRPEPTTGEVNLKIDGNYFNNSFGKVVNTLNLQYRYKESTSDTWSGYIPIEIVKSGDYYYWVGSIGNKFDYLKSYNFQINAYDKLMNLTIDRTVTQGIPVFDWGQNDFKFNVPVFDKFGTQFPNGLAIYNDGEIDPNETMENLILTKHSNSPGMGDFWYIETKFYNGKNLDSHRTQTAIPYQFPHNGVHIRSYHSGVWSNWRKVGLTNYSTEEQVIGTWIDGKPIYRKVVADELNMSNGTIIEVSTLNIDKILSIKTIEQRTNNLDIFDGVLYDNETMKFSVHFSPKNNWLESWCAPNSTFLATVILEYTKTTD